MKRELQQLRDVLERLEDFASDDENQSASLDAIADPLRSCQAELQRLEIVLASEKGPFSQLGQTLKWPFKEKEVKECLDILAGQRSVLQLALTADQRSVSPVKDVHNGTDFDSDSTVLLAIRDGVSERDRHVTDLSDSFKSFTTGESFHHKFPVRLRLKGCISILMTTDGNKEKIVDWLSAPDPSTNHNKARQVQQSKTGLWLLNSSEYQNWKTETDRVLWLHGIRKYWNLNASELEEFTHWSQRAVETPYSGEQAVSRTA